MASMITVTFEFEIGELVFFKGTQHTLGCRPKQFCVTERIAQECHGGVQKLYRLSGTDPHLLHPEIVLTREEPAYRPVSVEERADELRNAYARWTAKPEIEPAEAKRDKEAKPE